MALALQAIRASVRRKNLAASVTTKGSTSDSVLVPRWRTACLSSHYRYRLQP